MIKVVEKEKAKQHMNKNKHIKIKERRWKRPRGGPRCLPILIFIVGLKKEKKKKFAKSFEHGGPFINMALELQFPMKGIVCTYLFGV